MAQLSPHLSVLAHRLRRSVWIAAAVLAGACSAPGSGSDRPPTDGGERAVLGTVGKPLVPTAVGEVIADELLVGVSSKADAESIAAANGATMTYYSAHAARAVLRFDDPAATAIARRTLGADPRVASVESMAVLDGTGIGTSPGPITSLQWNLEAMKLGDVATWPAASGVRVAVLDTGAAFEDWTDGVQTYARAPDLSATLFAAGYDFVNDDSHPNDDEGHGTHIAAIIAASEGTIPMAGGVEIMPIKVLDHENKGTELALAEGIRFAADQGADIINMSLSFSPAYYPSRYLQDAVEYASAKGVVMVAAAGNHGADVVSYPAAFRDVIAVGGSKIGGNVTAGQGKHRWQNLDKRVRPAEYSNRGFLIDVLAPAGVIDRDLDGDGNPEAIVAQTFIGGDPLDFDYVLYAGTSQAAAQVTGLAAVMLAAKPGLSAAQVRALLGESAKAKSNLKTLDDTGRGYVMAGAALDSVAGESLLDGRPRYFSLMKLTMHQSAAGRFGRAEVEITNEAGLPVKGITVYGTFTGGQVEMVEGKANNDGVIVFESSPGASDLRLVAFQVDAVSDKIQGKTVFDRPRGAIRIDSCSLEGLSSYAVGSGIGTSPGPVIRFPASLPGQIESVTMFNFSWALAIVPMAVAIERDFFETNFTNADAAIVTTMGSGIGTSPIVFDPVTSFPGGLPASMIPAGYPEDCVDLVVRTFIGSLPEVADPIIVAPGGNCGNQSQCAAYVDALGSMWDFYVDGQGIGTSPIWQPGSGLGLDRFAHLGKLFERYADFGRTVSSAPVGAYGTVLQAAGLGLAPVGTPVGMGSAAASLPF